MLNHLQATVWKLFIIIRTQETNGWEVKINASTGKLISRRLTPLLGVFRQQDVMRGFGKGFSEEVKNSENNTIMTELWRGDKLLHLYQWERAYLLFCTAEQPFIFLQLRGFAFYNSYLFQSYDYYDERTNIKLKIRVHARAYTHICTCTRTRMHTTRL